MVLFSVQNDFAFLSESRELCVLKYKPTVVTCTNIYLVKMDSVWFNVIKDIKNISGKY